MKAANRESWQNEPMPERFAVLDYAAEFAPVEFEQIALGLIPVEMENKWFIFLEGHTLYLHRSWTGHCIYTVEFDQDGEKYWVLVAKVNRDPDQYSAVDDGCDSQTLHFLISNLLLGRKESFPAPPHLPDASLEGVYHYHVAGIPPPANRESRDPWWKFWK